MEDEERKTPKQIVDDANELARSIYRAMGYEVEKGYRFDRAHHPQEKGMWNIAVLAYDHIEGTDLESVLDEIE